VKELVIEAKVLQEEKKGVEDRLQEKEQDFNL